MTIEEKAKAYDEALEDMRVIYPNLKGDAKLAEHAFPQLAESEDERIRKEINILYSEIDTCISELLKARTDKDLEAEGKAFIKMEGLMVAILQDLSCIEDYLEKQKENTWSEEDDEKVKVMCKEGDLKPSERAWLKDLRNRVWKEQKPAEINEYEIIKKHITEDVLSSEVNKRLKECGWYVTEESAEWSEEDGKTINDACCWIAEYAGYLMDKNYGKASMLMGLTDKLKSLSPSWKPSEEQMEALQGAITYMAIHNMKVDSLVSLHKDLKKL